MDSTPSTTTLKTFLTEGIPMPTIRCTSSSGTNATGNWPIIRSVATWEEFGMRAIESQFGELLSTAMPALPTQSFSDFVAAATPSKGSGCKSNMLLIEWLSAAIQPALDVAKEQLGLFGDQGVSQDSPAPQVPGPSVPHYSSFTSGRPKQYFVIGVSKHSSSWHPEKTPDGDKFSINASAPLRHLAHCCSTINTRYGFVVTETELTVCRLLKVDSTVEPAAYHCDIATFPHLRPRTAAITSAMALWYLNILSMVSGDRAIPLRSQELLPALPVGADHDPDGPPDSKTMDTDSGPRYEEEHGFFQRSERMTIEQSEYLAFSLFSSSPGSGSRPSPSPGPAH